MQHPQILYEVTLASMPHLNHATSEHYCYEYEDVILLRVYSDDFLEAMVPKVIATYCVDMGEDVLQIYVKYCRENLRKWINET